MFMCICWYEIKHSYKVKIYVSKNNNEDARNCEVGATLATLSLQFETEFCWSVPYSYPLPGGPHSRQASCSKVLKWCMVIDLGKISNCSKMTFWQM